MEQAEKEEIGEKSRAEHDYSNIDLSHLEVEAIDTNMLFSKNTLLLTFKQFNEQLWIKINLAGVSLFLLLRLLLLMLERKKK
jgi:hypothetical protein